MRPSSPTTDGTVFPPARRTSPSIPARAGRAETFTLDPAIPTIVALLVYCEGERPVYSGWTISIFRSEYAGSGTTSTR